MFDCSRRTVERKMRESGLSMRNYTPLSDAELDAMVSQITSLFVTRFAKIDHVRAYCIMRNTNLKY